MINACFIGNYALDQLGVDQEGSLGLDWIYIQI